MKSDRKPSFVEDLGFAASTWRRFPWLPVVSVALSLLGGGSLPEPLWPVAFALGLAYGGWIGTERICYLRALRGLGVTRRELVRLTIAFLPRYIVLGLIISLPLLPVFAWFASRSEPGMAFESTAFYLVVTSLTAVLDVLLTFVTPALAFTTRRVRYALWIGIRMIRSEWPSCLLYVAVPPMAVVVVTQLIAFSDRVGSVVSVPLSILSTLLNLWFKGAVAAFYLRRHETSNDGAALLPRSAP